MNNKSQFDIDIYMFIAMLKYNIFNNIEILTNNEIKYIL